MILERSAFAALALLVAGCGQHAPPASAGARALQVPASSSGLRIVNVDDSEVPDFELSTPSGTHYNSREMIGQKPFMTVFFATWCEYCQDELKAMQQAIAKAGALEMQIIPVSVDGPETWNQVPDYLARFGIRDAAVRANDYPRFARAYDPFDTVPLLTIVGRNGALVDCLVGYDPAHAERMVSSLKLARSSPPPSRLSTSDAQSLERDLASAR
ncbi:MAG TPA: TlpA disulfide reductase family protein [Polyangiaceae bacterium]|nr:TlpA disulfide reductase family protein [Polyangiaceae bacterium]